MDRALVGAIAASCVSVLACLVRHHDAGLTFRHVLALFFPLAVIAFPEPIEEGFRRSFRGRVHGGEAVPGAFLQIGAWALLIAVIFVHHATYRTH